MEDENKEQQPSTSGCKDVIKSRIRSKTIKISEKIKERKNEFRQPLEPSSIRRRNSKSNSISSSLTSDPIDKQDKRKRKRQRNKVKSESDVIASNQQFAAANSAKFDDESELIITLLSLKPSKREEFLLRRAEDKKLIFYNKATKTYKLNEKLLASGSGCVSSSQVEVKAKPKHLELGKTLRFESWVNSVILEGVPPKDHKKYNFLFEARDKKLPSQELYINQPDFVNRLEKHAQYCVKEKLGEIIEGELRISNVNYYHAFVTRTIPNGKKDAMVCSKVARKFALHGDIVRCFVRNQEVSPEKTSEDNSDDSGEMSSKAFVIDIIKKVHDRKCIGLFSPKLGDDYATFIPRDSKLPHIRVKKENFPKEEEKNIGDILYVAQIDYFTLDVCYGKILFPVGKCGELESENKAILLSNHLKHEPYEDKFNEMYNSPLEITSEELAKREDIRKECVFTIDPLTAKDLDDAVSVNTLPDGNFEIGVHISDVSFFLEENSELDIIVKERTTSVYLVQEVFHMLPKPLCFKCSLLPGEDKYAFSVFWKISKNAEIISTRFARTILNSCTQFAYEHAQKIIDNENQAFDESDFPKIEGDWKVRDIVDRVKILNSLAQIMRKKRFDNGAMSINRPKIYFDLHSETGEPVNYKRYETDTANFLIEEFMLLANQSVARFIFDKYPNLAILRNHLPPQNNLILSCQKKLDANNIKLDVSSSKAIYASMRRVLEELSLSGEDLDSMGVALSHVISKTLKRAT
ncbi:DIS3L2 family protein [Megaselia abdita]